MLFIPISINFLQFDDDNDVFEDIEYEFIEDKGISDILYCHNRDLF